VISSTNRFGERNDDHEHDCEHHDSLPSWAKHRSHVGFAVNHHSALRLIIRPCAVAGVASLVTMLLAVHLGFRTGDDVRYIIFFGAAPRFHANEDHLLIANIGKMSNVSLMLQLDL